MSSVELTKTYHHLFPVASFIESARPAVVANGLGGGGGNGEGNGGGNGGEVVSLAHGPPAGRCFACAAKLKLAAGTQVGAAAAAAASAGAGPISLMPPSCVSPSALATVTEGPAPAREVGTLAEAGGTVSASASQQPSRAAAAAVGYECPSCGQAFCGACDELIHSVLHICPGCALALCRKRKTADT